MIKTVLLCICYGVLTIVLILCMIEIFICLKQNRCKKRKKYTEEGK